MSNYIQTTWNTGDLITKEKLNKLENGLAEITVDSLGGVKKAGDTMTGALHSTHVISYGTDKYPRFIFNLHDESKPAGWLLMNTDTRGMSFRMYMSDGVHYDSYALPVPSNLSRTTDVGYSILTTKSAVTIAQGGTGATSQGASHAALAVAGGYCDYTNATSFTFTLPNLSDAHYHHAIVFGGDTTTLYCYLMFINVQKNVSFYPLYTASTVRTLTGSVSGNTLTITVNATSYGGIRLIWFNDTATGS